MVFPVYDLDEIHRQNEKGNFSKIGAYMLRVSPDKNNRCVFGAPYKTPLFWKKQKQRVTEEFLGRVVTLIPNLREHIVYLDAATPATLYRYTLNYKGAAFGWAKTPSQTFERIFSRTTFMKGLF